MSFAVSRRPYWFRHRFRPLLVTSMTCLLLLPGGALTGATAATRLSSVQPATTRPAASAPQSEAVAQRSNQSIDRRSDSPGWLWLLLGIAPMGVALPWLYRWHRTNRSPGHMASPSPTPAAPIAAQASPASKSAKRPGSAALSGNSATSATGRSASQTPAPQAASPADQNTSDAQPAGESKSDLPQVDDRPLDQPLSALQASVPSVDLAQSAIQNMAQSATQSTQSPVESSTTRLSKIDIVEALAADLHSPDSAKRNKAIWELGQRGDSRAIQPLVDLLVDADSQQRSLILAALAEISTRTLKPMQRALMLSLQDESPEVRKNAIRDITRIYDLMAQASQLLQYAANDSDEEVQDTARWALGQLGRVRSAELGSYPGQPSLRPSEPD